MSLKKLLSATLALAVVLTPGAPAQAAAPTAYNITYQLLDGGFDIDGSEAATCRSKNIYLERGDYNWGETIATDVSTSTGLYRMIYLKTANYLWTDCLYPQYNPSLLPPGYYRHRSTLKIVADGDVPTAASGEFNYFPGFERRWTTWGSYLDPMGS